MTDPFDLLWKPLLEASAQTIVGAIGGYAFSKALNKLTARNTFEGPMDFWKRGIIGNTAQEDDQVYIDGVLSSYAQLFPGNPFNNGKKWNSLYEFEGTISSNEYQAMDFFAGGDAALRIGSLNGETVVGIYSRYGYVGDGLIAVIATKYLRAMLPVFFDPNFVGARAMIGGRVAKCPTQHGYIVQAIASQAGINVNLNEYKDLYYLKVNSLKLFNKDSEKTFSLIGSPWAATENKDEQYLVQYGYLDNPNELETCVHRIKNSSSWDQTRVYYDDITSPSEEISFKNSFIK